MKVKFNPFVQSASGQMGDMVFYELNGQPVARAKGEYTDPRSTAQLAHRERVRLAAAWSRQTMKDPRQKADYKAACQGHQTPYNIGFRDFMTPPVVQAIHLDEYTGKAGQKIRVQAWDDFEVAQVIVTIRNAARELIEEGAAQLNEERTRWEFTTTADVPGNQAVLVEVLVADRPGNKTISSQWQHLAG